jgi:hypothetical protein
MWGDCSDHGHFHWPTGYYGRYCHFGCYSSAGGGCQKNLGMMSIQMPPGAHTVGVVDLEQQAAMALNLKNVEVVG